MVKKYGFEIIKSKVPGASALKFQTREEAIKFRRKIKGVVVRLPYNLLGVRKLYFKKKDGSYGYI